MGQTRNIAIVAGGGAVLAGLLILATKAKVVPPTVYTCPYCGAQFSSQEELQAHITTKHPEQPPAPVPPVSPVQQMLNEADATIQKLRARLQGYIPPGQLEDVANEVNAWVANLQVWKLYLQGTATAGQLYAAVKAQNISPNLPMLGQPAITFAGCRTWYEILQAHTAYYSSLLYGLESRGYSVSPFWYVAMFQADIINLTIYNLQMFWRFAKGGGDFAPVAECPFSALALDGFTYNADIGISGITQQQAADGVFYPVWGGKAWSGWGIEVSGYPVPPDPYPFVCFYCGARFASYEELQNHVWRYHTSEF
jgi:hypothetical protein